MCHLAISELDRLRINVISTIVIKIIDHRPEGLAKSHRVKHHLTTGYLVGQSLIPRP